MTKKHIHAGSPYTKSRIRTHALSKKERRIRVGNLSFGPWYFGIGPWYLVQSVDPRYWVQGIGSTWFWTMVLREA